MPGSLGPATPGLLGYTSEGLNCGASARWQELRGCECRKGHKGSEGSQQIPQVPRKACYFFRGWGGASWRVIRKNFKNRPQ